MNPDGPTPTAARVILAGLTVTVLVLTGHPTEDPSPAACLAGIICGARGTADVLLNIMMFVPLGWALARARLTDRRAVLLAAPLVFSLGIEVAQTLIPGRHPNPGDVLFNSLGGWLGLATAAAAPRALRTWRGSDRAALAWAAGLIGVFGLTGALLQPILPDNTVYFGQWTPTLGGLEPYRGGEVLSAEIAGERMPSFALANTAAVRAALSGGVPITVRFVVGPEPAALAPVFAIADRELRGVILFGIAPGRLVLSVRTRADALLLDSPHHEVPLTGPLRDARGDTVTVRFRWPVRPGQVAFQVNGAAAGTSHWTLARGWAVFYHRVSWPGPLRGWLDGVWMAVLFLPLGYGAARTWRFGASVLLAAGAAVGIAAVSGLSPLGLGGVLAAGGGMLVGYLARLLVPAAPP